MIIIANVDFIKNIKNYHDQELMRFIFQTWIIYLINWYISVILKVIKPVEKEYICKCHFDHRICIRIFPLLSGFCYLYSHLNCLYHCQHTPTRYGKCKGDLTLGKDSCSNEELPEK